MCVHMCAHLKVLVVLADISLASLPGELQGGRLFNVSIAFDSKMGSGRE